MRRLSLVLALLALLLPGLLTACEGNKGGASTSTPTATLGTDSAATKVGGLPDSLRTTAPGNGPQ